MTDAEINLAIAKIEYWDNDDCPECFAHYGGYVYFPYRPSWGMFNYVNDWKDIGPIIEREKIDIRSCLRTEGTWSAITYDEHNDKVSEGVADTPTKAAALCYLKMKGVEL